MLDFEAFRKTTSIGLPLSPSSYHPPSVHKSWPKSMIARTRSLTSSKERADTLCYDLLIKWKAQGIMAPDQPHPHQSPVLTLPLLNQFCARLILPYNCWWPLLGIGKLLQVANRDSVDGLPHAPIIFKTSWMLSGRHLSNVVRSMNDNQHGADDRLTIFA
jgi:hypothetical protein